MCERFENKYKINPVSGCWEWQAGFNHNGYGQFHADGKNVRAHKFSYVKHKGPIPDGLILLHSCDNRACVNPDHLTPGTQKENWQDAVNKGRLIPGRKKSRK